MSPAARILAPFRVSQLIVVSLGLCQLFAAEQTGRSANQQPAIARGLKDPAQVEAFVDGVIAAQKEALHISGAAVAIVKDGQLFFAKGYGNADIEKGKKVDPAKTLFRIGSVSKLFTWTAVMQLVEQGKLDLNKDINAYLKKFKVPSTYPEPITLAHLLAHTPGFEAPRVRTNFSAADKMMPLGEVLADGLPARVRPPGQFASYSNHGTALAGYIVEEVSGMPWEAYVEQSIFQPLGMSHSTARQPLPATLSNDMSVGYWYGNGEFKAKGFEFISVRPAGAVSSTAVDMANFMIAHLQDGRLGSVRILSETTARQMHSRLFTHAPGLNAMLHGFYEMTENGEKIYGHEGDTPCFHAQLALFPERNVGLFVCYNSDTGADARVGFFKAFVDHYYPPPEIPKVRLLADFRQRGQQLAGCYVPLRRSFTSLARLAVVRDNDTITVTPDGYLQGLGRRWVEVEPLVFQSINGSERAVFRAVDGHMYLFLNGMPYVAFERLEGIETPTSQVTLLILAAILPLAIMLAGFIGWPISAYRRRHRRPGEVVSPWPRLLGWAACALFLSFAAKIAIDVITQENLTGGRHAMLFNHAVPLIAAGTLVPVMAWAVWAWTKEWWGIIGRVHYTLVVPAGLALLWWLNHYDLLCLRFT